MTDSSISVVHNALKGIELSDKDKMRWQGMNECLTPILHAWTTLDAVGEEIKPLAYLKSAFQICSQTTKK
jgi:hypothetical protein